MYQIIYRPVFPVLLSVLSLVACSEQAEEKKVAQPEVSAVSVVPAGRWYRPAQVAAGYVLFQKFCAQCHKPDASGSPDWKSVDAEGKLPPPPLNGTAHAWHHPLPLLRRIVQVGGVPLGGSMPAFKDKLSAEEIDSILAWVQSHWSDKIYATWHQINQQHQSN